jgi:Ankyrin repeats (3 copies)
VSEDPIDDLYRRASDARSNGPSESVRRAILRHASEQAAQRAPVEFEPRARRTSRAWRWPAVYGGLAAAALAGLLVAPRFLTSPTSPPAVERSDSDAVRNAVVPTEPAPTKRQPPYLPKLEELRPSAEGLRQSAGAAPQARNDAAAQTQTNRAAFARNRASPAAGVAAESARSQVQAAPAPVSPSPPLDAPAAAPPAPPPPAALAAPAARAAASAPWPTPHLLGHAPGPPSSAVALRSAAESGDMPRLRALLAEQIDIDARDAHGRTALMVATLAGQNAAVDALLASGADPNGADADGTTPLAAALDAHQSSIAASLRRAGAREPP